MYMWLSLTTWGRSQAFFLKVHPFAASPQNAMLPFSTNPLPSICREGFFPLFKMQNLTNPSLHILFYIFIFHFIFIYLYYCFEFFLSLWEGFVGRILPPFKMQNLTNPSLHILFYIFIFHFIFIYLYYCFEFFLSFFPKNFKFFPKVEKLFSSVWGGGGIIEE